MTTLLTLLDLYAGGPGSGCNPSAGRCGRPRGTSAKVALRKYATKLSSKVPGLVRKGGRETIATVPVRPGAVKTRFTTEQGAQYTVIKSPKSHGSYRDQMKVPSSYKGQFKKEADVNGIEGNRLVSLYQSTKPNGMGQAVAVHRDYGQRKVIVQEITHDEDKWRSGAKEFVFRNFGKASGFVANRYGIKLTLPKPGWNR